MNLHALAVAVVRDSQTPDPDLMAKTLVSQIDPSDYVEALNYLAKDLVRRAVHDQRATANGAEPRMGSRKVALAREAWRQLLDTPEFVPSAGWLFLRDATCDQVLEIAGARDQKSQELAAAANRYRRLAGAMEEHLAEIVSDLPPAVLEGLLNHDLETAA